MSDTVAKECGPQADRCIAPCSAPHRSWRVRYQTESLVRGRAHPDSKNRRSPTQSQLPRQNRALSFQISFVRRAPLGARGCIGQLSTCMQRFRTARLLQAQRYPPLAWWSPIRSFEIHRYWFVQHNRLVVGKYDEVTASMMSGLPVSERAIPDRIVNLPWLIEVCDRTAGHDRKIKPRLICKIRCSVTWHDNHTVFAPVAQVLGS